MTACCSKTRLFTAIWGRLLLYGEDCLYEPSQHDPKKNAIPDWVNRRPTRSYWNFVGWLGGGRGALGRVFCTFGETSALWVSPSLLRGVLALLYGEDSLQYGENTLSILWGRIPVLWGRLSALWGRLSLRASSTGSNATCNPRLD